MRAYSNRHVAAVVACIVAIMLALGIQPAQAASTIASHRQAALTPTASGDDCTSEGNSADPAIPNISTGPASGDKRCITGVKMNTRGRIYADCLTRLPNDDRYAPGQCTRGTSDNVEAIAQARMIYHLNTDDTLRQSLGLSNVIAGVGPGVSPDIQWETRLAPLGERPDLVVYNHTHVDGPVYVGEVKVQGNPDLIKDVKDQVDGYTRWFTRNTKFTGEQINWSADPQRPYHDRFTISCGTKSTTYDVTPDTSNAAREALPGVLVARPTTGSPDSNQVTFDDEDAASCPIEVGVDGDVPAPPGPSSSAGSSGAGNTFCNLDPVELQKWLRDASDYLASVGKTTATAIQTRIVRGYVNKWLEGRNLANNVPQEYCATIAGGFGDPHMTTLDGLAYDMQSVGEFHLLKADSMGIDVQARFVPWGNRTNVSMIDRIAFPINGFNIEMDALNHVWVDGQLTALDQDRILYLNGGAQILRSDVDEYLVLWPMVDGKAAVMRWAANSVAMRLSTNVATNGLLGDHDGNPRDDLKLADGTQMAASASPGAIDGPYANSWRVTANESRFTYASGQTTATFTNLNFPTDVVRTSDFPADDIEAATARCNAGQVADGPQLEACVYDVLVTGDDKYVDAAAAVRGEIFDPKAKEFDSAGVLEETFASPVATNFAASRYLDDPATSRVAGPFFDGKGYSFYEIIVPRHDTLVMDLRLIAYGPITSGSPQSVDVVVDSQTPVTAQLEDGSATISRGSIVQTTGGVTSSGTTFRTYDLQVPVEHFGAALKVQLLPHNFRGVLNTSLGVNSVKLALTTNPADQISTSIPFDVAASPALQAQGAGALPTGGAEDDYHFHLTQGAPRGLSLEPTSCPSGLIVNLLDAAGSSIQRLAGCDRGATDPLPAGDYSIEVSGGKGDYGLQVREAPAPQSFGYQLGQTVGDGKIGGLGESGAGRLETGASKDQYTFSTTAARTSVLFARSTSCDNAKLISVDNGQVLGAVCGSPHQYWLAAGSYRIDVSARPRDQIGAYSFSSYVLVDGRPADLTGNVTGNPVDVALGSEQNGAVVFNAEAGHRYRVWIGDTNLWHSQLQVRVYEPDGALLSEKEAGGSLSSFINGQYYVESAVAGTYRVEVDPVADLTGVTSVRVKDITDRPVVIATDGSAATASLDIGERGVYTFHAAAGQRFRVWQTDTSFWHSQLGLQVYAPDGTLLSSKETGDGQYGLINGQYYVDPAVAGTYRVVAASPYDLAGSISVHVKDITDRPVVIATDGSAATASLDIGERGVYTFPATAGQRFRIWQSDTSFWHEQLYVSVYAPDGTLLSSKDTGDGQHGLITGQSYVDPAVAGTYKVVVASPYDLSGSISLHVRNATDADVAVPTDGSAVNVDLDAGQNGTYTFDAAAGQRFRLWQTDATFWHEQLHVRIYAPDGSLLNEHEAGDSSHGQVYTQYDIDPAVAGRYRVVVDPAGDAAGTLKLYVKGTPADVNVVVPTDGSATAVDLDERQNGTYTFDAVAGDRFRIWQSNYTFPFSQERARVYAPDGTLLSDQSVGQWPYGVLDGKVFIDPAVTGTYKVVIDPQGDATLSTKLHVKKFADDRAEVPTDGSATIVNLDERQDGIYTFDAVAGHRFRIWQTGYSFPFSQERARVYAPDGTLLSDQSVGQWPYGVLNGQYYVDPSVSGRYKVVVDPQGDDVISTVLHVKDISDRVVTDAATDGSAIDVNLEQGQNGVFKFHAEAGQRFRIWQSDYSLSYSEQKARVYAPDGTLLNEQSVGQFPYGVLNGQYYVDPAVAGTYTVVVDPQGDAEVSTKLHIKDASDVVGVAPTDGSSIDVDLSAGQNAVYRFDAAAGQRFRIWQSDYAFPFTDERVRIYAPDNSVLIDTAVGQWPNGVLNGQYYVDPAVTGTYKVVIDPQGDALVSTKLHVKDASDLVAAAPTNGSSINLALGAGQNAVYHFDAQAGQRFRVWQSNYTFPYTDQRQRIYAPDGTLLNETSVGQWANGVLNGEFYVDPTVSGRYKVVVDPQGDAAISTALHVKDISDLEMPVTLDGSPTAMRLDARQNGTFSFAPRAGEKIDLDLTSTSTGAGAQQVHLFKPDDTLIREGQAGSGVHWVIDEAVAGTYRLVVDHQTAPTANLTLTLNASIALAKPTGLRIGPDANATSTLTWGAVKWATRYEVFADGDSTPIYDGLATSTALTGLPSGEHQLRVQAFYGPYSSPLSKGVVLHADGTTPAPSYDDEVLADNPMAYYRLSDPAGSTVVTDSSGGGHDGIWTNRPAIGNSLIAGDDPSAQFDGSFREGRVPVATWMYTPVISVEAWIKPVDTQSAVIVARQAWGYGYGEHDAWALDMFGGKLVWSTFKNNSNNDFKEISSQQSLSLNVVHHVVATYDGSTIKLYIDGQLDSSTPDSGALTTGPSDLTIGAPDYPAARWNGLMDEVAIYPNVLSPVRVAAHYAAGTN